MRGVYIFVHEHIAHRRHLVAVDASDGGGEDVWRARHRHLYAVYEHTQLSSTVHNQMGVLWLTRVRNDLCGVDVDRERLLLDRASDLKSHLQLK